MYLSKLDNLLDKKIGNDWHELELETISLELGAVLDAKSMLQIIILKSIQSHPDIILNDADYFLRFVEIANGNNPDPHHHDIPTSLELSFALHELEDILGENMEVTHMISNVVRYIINDEGHGKAASDVLAKYGKVAKSTTEFSKAYDAYTKEMRV